MTDICPYCKTDLSTEKECVDAFNILAKSFPNSDIEWEDDVWYVDYDRVGQDYAVIRLVFIYKNEQWRISNAYIATQEFQVELDAPEKFWKNPADAFRDAKLFWERDVED